VVLILQPAEELASLDQPSAFDLVGGELAAGCEAVHLLGLAAEDDGEFVDGQEGG
jgi:hypothetical protein